MLIATLFVTIQQYLRYWTHLHSMEGLDDRMLSDIGLSRAELPATAWRQVERQLAHRTR